jgi:hypothetical protein
MVANSRRLGMRLAWRAFGRVAGLAVLLALVPMAVGNAAAAGVMTTIGGSVTPAGKAVKVQVKGQKKGAKANSASGFFSIQGTRLSGPRTVVFKQGKKKYLMPVSAPPGSSLMLNGVTFNSDGTASADQEDLQVSGTLTSVDCGATPNSLVITTTTGDVTMNFDPATTKLEDNATDTRMMSCSDLSTYAGQSIPVNAEATVNSDGSYTATEVDLNPDSQPPSGSVDFGGTISAANCPSSVTVQRSSDSILVVVNISDSTTIVLQGEDNQTTGACTDLPLGASVEVEGTANSDGSVNATKIKLDDTEFDAEGTINSIDCVDTPQSMSFTPNDAVDPVTVTIGATTEIQVNDMDNAACVDLTTGSAKVEGSLQGDGTIAAKSIEQSAGGD